MENRYVDTDSELERAASIFHGGQAWSRQLLHSLV